MDSQSDASIPRLQPPGAGLPWTQKLMLRLWLGPVVSRRTPLADCRARYEAVTSQILALAKTVEQADRARKILVPPQPGLEDSSRYWSVNDTLEHLLIVSKGMESVILSLSAGKIPLGEANIAKVKPRGAEGDLLAEFNAYAPDLLKRVDEALANSGMNIQSPLKFRHPWFGNITARQWYWLLSVHQSIHCRQMKAIVRALS